MVPGDLIEWVYKSSHMVIDEDEMLYSTPMNRWVPIGSGLVHTLISISDEQITWLNEKGCFHARVDDTISSYVVPTSHWVLPRARG